MWTFNHKNSAHASEIVGVKASSASSNRQGRRKKPPDHGWRASIVNLWYEVPDLKERKYFLAQVKELSSQNAKCKM